MVRPYTFTRYADHQVAPKEAVNDLQAAIEVIDAGGTNAGAALTVQDEGTPLATSAVTLNFVGAGVAATGTTGTKTITISGAAGGSGNKLGYTIAASNTDTALKNLADYVCTGTNDHTVWQSAIDALETGVGGNTAGAKTLYVLPGSYHWAATVNAKSCQIIGTTSANSGVRVFWDGADNTGPALVKVDPASPVIIGGKSYWYMSGINFRPGTLGDPSVWLDFTDGSSATVDTSCRINECDFYGGYVQIKIDQWVNIHWDHLRFDNWRTWSIQMTPIATNNLSTFRCGQFSFDSRGSATALGWMLIDLTANPSNIGTIHLEDARMEVNNAWAGTAQGMINIKTLASGANARVAKIELENITYQDVGNLMANDCLVYLDTQGGAAVNMQVILNNVHVDSVSKIIGGGVPTTVGTIPIVQGGYGWVLLDIAPDGMSVITDGIHILSRTAGTITDALRMRKAAQTQDCFQISNDGQIVRGLGSAAPAIGFYVDVGAPSAGRGSNGSIYQRTDGSGTTDNFYVKRGGAWVGIA